jgi:eukaryotic-like serine/threonine-protein kinase
LLNNNCPIDIFESMKNLLKSRLVRRILYFFAALIIIIILLNNLIIPWYVESPETVVPNVVGVPNADAIELLTNMGFEPMIVDTTYGENYPPGSIFLQKPKGGDIVKQGRNIFLFISGGEFEVYVPELIGKTILDAKFALERIGLKLGRVTQLQSEKPEEMIFDQEFAEGTPLKKGQTVDVTVSAGRGGGVIKVPDLIGKSLAQSEVILSDLSLTVGKVNYQLSLTLLPNTVLDQYPSSGNKLNPGESVDLFVTKSSEPEMPETKKE